MSLADDRLKQLEDHIKTGGGLDQLVWGTFMRGLDASLLVGSMTKGRSSPSFLITGMRLLVAAMEARDEEVTEAYHGRDQEPR